MTITPENRSVPTVKWAVLGTGAIAATFAQDIRLARHAELVAVCSRTEASARAFSQRYGGLQIVPNLDALATDPHIDAVYIATPNTSHFEQARLILDAGKPVLVEKPLVMTTAQAQLLADLSRQRNVFAMEALWTVFLPAIEDIRALLLDKAIGRITGIRAELAFAKPLDRESRFFSRALGGGALLDLGIYPIALAIALFGAPRSVAGRWTAAETGTDMAADMRLGYSGFDAAISCGFDRDGDNRFIIDGETGSLVIDAPFLSASRIIVTRNCLARYLTGPAKKHRFAGIIGKVAARLPLPGLAVRDHRFEGTGLQFEIDAASNAILQGKREEPRMPLSASIAALGIIETVLASPPL